MKAPFHLQTWIDENREHLRPPVGNQVLYEDTEFIVMAVGGPNARSDYHINQSEEIFYMVEGDMVLRIMEEDGPRDLPIRQGEIFLLPGGIPHSPIRKADTVGLVIERTRREGEKDALRWYCPACGAHLHEERFALEDIVVQLREILEGFYGSEARRTCGACGHVMPVPGGGD